MFAFDSFALPLVSAVSKTAMGLCFHPPLLSTLSLSSVAVWYYTFSFGDVVILHTCKSGKTTNIFFSSSIWSSAHFPKRETVDNFVVIIVASTAIVPLLASLQSLLSFSFRMCLPIIRCRQMDMEIQCWWCYCCTCTYQHCQLNSFSFGISTGKLFASVNDEWQKGNLNAEFRKTMFNKHEYR